MNQSHTTPTSNPTPPLPHPVDAERADAIRRWHIDQVVSAHDTTVALLNIAIHHDGEVRTRGLCIEPEHAPVVIPELRRLIEYFESQLPKGPAGALGY